MLTRSMVGRSAATVSVMSTDTVAEGVSSVVRCGQFLLGSRIVIVWVEVSAFSEELPT